jgi:dihydroorotate dehydrogenase electron transfer subunit
LINSLRVVNLLRIETENLTTKTFTIEDKLLSKSNPGQFLMLWVPNVGEIPLSIMNVESNEVSVTVKNVGNTTRMLHDLVVGEKVGIRGPFGNCFSYTKGKILIVGGGTGVAPLLFLAKILKRNNADTFFMIGAKTRSDLLFIKKITDLCSKDQLVTTTEDGSYGIKCLVTKPLKKILEKETFEMVYSCGPELMVRKVFEIVDSYGIHFEASLERLMRCSIGLCGSCMIGKYRVCKDGPVFNEIKLREVTTEFGVSKMSFDGKKIKIGK